MKNLLTLLTVSILLSNCVPQKLNSPPPEVAAQSDAKQVEISKEPRVERGTVTEVMVEKVYAQRVSDQALLIDTRPPLFYNLGHIDGAISIPLKSFDKSFAAKKSEVDAAVSAGKVLVIYCANEVCVDSHRMSEKLATMGYDVSVFKGGWELWKQTGLE